MVKNLQCVSHGSLKRFPHTFTSKNQNEDEVINLVCEAACDWEGTFTCDDFFSHNQLCKLGSSPHLRLDSDPRREERI